MTDETAPEQALAEPYAAACERCPWTMTGERAAVIRAGLEHVCEPPTGDQPPAEDEPPATEPAMPAEGNAANG